MIMKKTTGKLMLLVSLSVLAACGGGGGGGGATGGGSSSDPGWSYHPGTEDPTNGGLNESQRLWYRTMSIKQYNTTLTYMFGPSDDRYQKTDPSGDEEGTMHSYTYEPTGAKTALLNIQIAITPQFSGKPERRETHEVTLLFTSATEADAVLSIDGKTISGLKAYFDMQGS